MKYVRLKEMPTFRLSTEVWKRLVAVLDLRRKGTKYSRSFAAEHWLREKLGLTTDITTKKPDDAGE